MAKNYRAKLFSDDERNQMAQLILNVVSTSSLPKEYFPPEFKVFRACLEFFVRLNFSVAPNLGAVFSIQYMLPAVPIDWYGPLYVSNEGDHAEYILRYWDQPFRLTFQKVKGFAGYDLMDIALQHTASHRFDRIPDLSLFNFDTPNLTACYELTKKMEKIFKFSINKAWDNYAPIPQKKKKNACEFNFKMEKFDW